MLSGCLGALLGIVGAVGLERISYLELTRTTDWWCPLLAAYPEEAYEADGLQPKKRTVGAMKRDEW